MPPASALRAHDEGRAPAVAKDLDADRAVVEHVGSRIAGKLGRRAFEPGARAPGFAALAHDHGARRRRGERDDARVGEAQRAHRLGHRAAAGELLGPGPGEVPLGPARNIEGDEERRPGHEAADAVGDGAGAAVVADEPRRRLVGAVAAEERQVDEARDPEPHVVEPDQDAQPVVGEEPEEQDEAESPERLRRLGRVGADDDRRADRAVLIVPARIGRLAQERVDDRRHPQAPAQHAHALRDHALDALSG